MSYLFILCCLNPLAAFNKAHVFISCHLFPASFHCVSILSLFLYPLTDCLYVSVLFLWGLTQSLFTFVFIFFMWLGCLTVFILSFITFAQKVLFSIVSVCLFPITTKLAELVQCATIFRMCLIITSRHRGDPEQGNVHQTCSRDEGNFEVEVDKRADTGFFDYFSLSY